MPRKRRAARKPRRVLRRIKRKSKKLTPIGIPTSKIVHLRWKGYVSLDPSAAAAATRVYSANGMYNVDQGAAGEYVPNWFNEWMAMYQHYTVLGSKIKAYVSATASSANDCIVGIGIGSTSTSVTTYDYWPTQRGTRMKTISGIYSKSNTTVTNAVAMNKYFKRKVLQDDAYQGTLTSNPTEGVFYHVFAQDFGAGADIAAVKVMVIIDYVAMLRETKEIAPST